MLGLTRSTGGRIPNQTQRMEESKLVNLCGWKELSYCFLYSTVGLCDCARCAVENIENEPIIVFFIKKIDAFGGYEVMNTTSDSRGSIKFCLKLRSNELLYTLYSIQNEYEYESVDEGVRKSRPLKAQSNHRTACCTLHFT
jgi:hypothetical protein